MEMTAEFLQELKNKRQWLSDGDSHIICLLIDEIKRLEEEIQQMEDREYQEWLDNRDRD